MASPDSSKHELLSAHLVSRYGTLQENDPNNPIPTNFGARPAEVRPYEWSGLVDFSPNHTEQPLAVKLRSFTTPTEKGLQARTYIDVVDGDNTSRFQLFELNNGYQIELRFSEVNYLIPLATVRGSVVSNRRALMMETKKNRSLETPLYQEDLDPDKTFISKRYFVEPRQAISKLHMIANAIKSNSPDSENT